jgi:FAD/FMN-containing dehydrogenase
VGTGAVTRRKFLERSGKAAAAAAIAAQPGWLAACGSSSSSHTGASSADWSKLSKMLHGRLLRPGDPGYGTSALSYNKLYDSIRPQGIATCANAADARTALSWAEQTGEVFTVMSGSHSYAGYSTCTGLIIDMSSLNQVGFDRSTGQVTIGVGVRNQQLFSTLPPLRVGLPHGRCPVTGVGGFVLGGGFGFTSRTMGMLSDTLVRTEIITASGELLTCDAQHNSDLYWACRGGAGGSFGINTAYTLQTHPLPEKVSVYKLECPWSSAPAMLKALQAMMLHAPNQLGCRIGLGATGLHTKTFEANTLGEYVGPVGQLRELLAPVISAAKPKSVMIEEVPLARGVKFLAADVPFDRFASKSSYAADAFSDTAIAALVREVEKIPGSSNSGGNGIAIFCLGGAVNQVPADATAYFHRNARFLINFEATWEANDTGPVVAANLSWLESIYQVMQPYVLPQSYQNWPDPTLTNWKQAYYGSNLQRLAQIKVKYDPKNRFRYAQSVPLKA